MGPRCLCGPLTAVIAMLILTLCILNVVGGNCSLQSAWRRSLLRIVMMNVHPGHLR